MMACNEPFVSKELSCNGCSCYERLIQDLNTMVVLQDVFQPSQHFHCLCNCWLTNEDLSE